jgi:hypothetical protein
MLRGGRYTRDGSLSRSDRARRNRRLTRWVPASIPAVLLTRRKVSSSSCTLLDSKSVIRKNRDVDGRAGSPPVRDLPSFNARAEGYSGDTRVGFTRPTPYRTPPQGTYQMRLRGNRTHVKDHFTPSRSPSEIEKWANDQRTTETDTAIGATPRSVPTQGT